MLVRSAGYLLVFKSKESQKHNVSYMASLVQFSEKWWLKTFFALELDILVS